MERLDEVVLDEPVDAITPGGPASSVLERGEWAVRSSQEDGGCRGDGREVSSPDPASPPSERPASDQERDERAVDSGRGDDESLHGVNCRTESGPVAWRE